MSWNVSELCAETRIAEALKQRLEEVAASALDTATRLDAGKTPGSYW